MIEFAQHPWMSGLFLDDEIAAIFAPEADLNRFLRVEAAWTRAKGEVEGNDAADAIAHAILTTPLSPSDLREGCAEDGLPVPSLVRLLKSKIGEDAGSWIHTGMTSQDVLDTSQMLALLEVFDLLSDRLTLLDQILFDLDARFGGAPIMAYTRMQPALETTVSDTVARWRQPLLRLIEDCKAVNKSLSVIQWGGPIGIRDQAEQVRLGATFAKHLNLTDPGQSWHTDRTMISAAVHVMARIGSATGKIGEDVALMAAIGKDQITLSGGSSSAMPHKNNPVKAELLITLSDHATFLQAALSRSARHEGHRSGVAWIQEMLSLPALCLTAGIGLKQALSLMNDIRTIGA